MDDKSKHFETVVREASLAIDKLNVAHDPVPLMIWNVLDGTFDQNLADAKLFLERKFEELAVAAARIRALETALHNGQKEHYIANTGRTN